MQQPQTTAMLKKAAIENCTACTKITDAAKLELFYKIFFVFCFITVITSSCNERSSKIKHLITFISYSTLTVQCKSGSHGTKLHS